MLKIDTCTSNCCKLSGLCAGVGCYLRRENQCYYKGAERRQLSLVRRDESCACVGLGTGNRLFFFSFCLVRVSASRPVYGLTSYSTDRDDASCNDTEDEPACTQLADNEEKDEEDCDDGFSVSFNAAFFLIMASVRWS